MKVKRTIATILTFVLFCTNIVSANAAGIIGELITDVSVLNSLTVSAALNTYFNSREAYLLNQASTIDRLLAGIEDEASHREMYSSKNIILVDSAISIEDIIAGDNYADADVTETVTYIKDGITATATVKHKLLLALYAGSVVSVVYDRYYEAFSGFRSCSYVDEASATAPYYDVGSGGCIVHVAEGELGYTEKANGYTKYGAWYNSLYAVPGVDFTYAGWCVMFVVWCAAQIEISSSVIPHVANPEIMLDYFDNLGQYRSRITAVNNWAPATGDLVFFADDRVNASHIGIIRYTDGNYIYVVHGNNGQNKVDFMPVSRTDDWILGYAKPAYAQETHSFLWAYDGEQHWYRCVMCGYEEGRTAHTLSSTYSKNSTQHWRYCTTCNYEVERGSHIQKPRYSKNATHHWKDCLTCGYEMNKQVHSLVQSAPGEAYICTACGHSTTTSLLGLRTTYALHCRSVKH